MEIYKKYRPKRFDRIFGQGKAVATLQSFFNAKDVPHSMLFSGPSGCGKTTLARITAKKLGCKGRDFVELNCADFRGVEIAREIRLVMGLAPVEGRCRVWLLDEVHQLTGQAQNAFLKMLEDTPRHVYFLLVTTDPQKVLNTVRTRCTDISVTALDDDSIGALVDAMLQKLEVEISDVSKEKIVEVAQGSARKAMVLLNQIYMVEDEDEQLEILGSADTRAQAIELARALLNGRSWKEVAGILKGIDEEPEGLRYMVLGYCNAVLLGGGKLANRAFIIMNSFADNFYDSKKAGLTMACYEVVINNDR